MSGAILTTDQMAHRSWPLSRRSHNAREAALSRRRERCLGPSRVPADPGHDHLRARARGQVLQRAIHEQKLLPPSILGMRDPGLHPNDRRLRYSVLQSDHLQADWHPYQQDAAIPGHLVNHRANCAVLLYPVHRLHWSSLGHDRRQPWQLRYFHHCDCTTGEVPARLLVQSRRYSYTSSISHS